MQGIDAFQPVIVEQIGNLGSQWGNMSDARFWKRMMRELISFGYYAKLPGLSSTFRIPNVAADCGEYLWLMQSVWEPGVAVDYREHLTS